MNAPTLQTARNLEAFVLEFINETDRLRLPSMDFAKIVSLILRDYHAEVERRKAEALKYVGAADRRKTSRVTNFEHLTEVSE